MKRLIIMAVLLAAASAFAGGVLQSDLGKSKIQGFAPNGKKSQSLTVNKTAAIDASDSAAWAVYTPIDCVYRIQSTATRVGVLHTAPGGTTTIRVVNGITPHLSYSGCTGGQLQRDGE